MLEKIEDAFRGLLSALQVARLYPDWHPQFKKAIDQAYVSLEAILQEREELVIGIVGEELAFEKEIFFDLSKTLKPMILYLKERAIEKIVFYRGLTNGELSKFVTFLITPKEDIRHGPQEALTALGIKNIAVMKIGALPLSEEAPKNYLNVYEDSLDKIGSSLETMLNEEGLDRLALRLTVNNMIENLLGRYQDFLNLATVKRYDLKTSFHFTNVAVLSMYFASKMGFAREEVLDIGIAALFHDIGKLYISRKIIQKPRRLSEEEFDKIKSHTIVGAEILLKYVDVLGILPVVVSFEHHLKYDLSGYPKLSYYQKPHIASQLVSICDVYDALSQKRGYKGDYPPEMIYNLMMREKDSAFESSLLDRFFKVTGVWPIGTIVSLSDGRIAVVRGENEDDVFSPQVEVIVPQDKKENIDLRTVKEKLKIERSLDPAREGKEYLTLI